MARCTHAMRNLTSTAQTYPSICGAGTSKQVDISLQHVVELPPPVPQSPRATLSRRRAFITSMFLSIRARGASTPTTCPRQSPLLVDLEHGDTNARFHCALLDASLALGHAFQRLRHVLRLVKLKFRKGETQSPTGSTATCACSAYVRAG